MSPAGREFTLEDYAAFLGGDGNPAIIAALTDAESEPSRYFAGMRAAAGQLLVGSADEVPPETGNAFERLQ
jgi:hypothetical protein